MPNTIVQHDEPPETEDEPQRATAPDHEAAALPLAPPDGPELGGEQAGAAGPAGPQPGPATVRDPELIQAAYGPKKPRSVVRIVLLLLSVVVALAAGSGAAAYWFLWRYDATARLHVPDNASFAVRLEASEILLYEPVRKHLWPVFDEVGKSSRVKRIEEATGVNLETDVREIVVATVDGTAWVMLLGGQLPSDDDFLEQLGKALEKEDDAWSLDDGFLEGPRGVIIAQAEDGTLIIGTEKDLVRASLPRREPDDAYPLQVAGAASFRIDDEALSAASSINTFLGKPEAIGSFRRADGVVTLGDAPKLHIELTPNKGADAEDLVEDVENGIADARLLLFLHADVAGEKQALRDAEVKAEDGKVIVDVPWPADALEDAIEELGESLQDR